MPILERDRLCPCSRLGVLAESVNKKYTCKDGDIRVYRSQRFYHAADEFNKFSTCLVRGSHSISSRGIPEKK